MAQQAIAQIRAEVFAAFQVHRQRPGCFSQGNCIEQIAGRKAVHQQVEIGMLAEAIIEDGAKQMDRANFRPGLAESISRRLGLVQPGVTSLLQLLGIGGEALSPVVLPMHGHRFILMPSRRIAAAWPPLA